MHKVFLVTFMAIVTISCPSVTKAQASHPAEKDAASVHAGEEIFTQRCFQCHSVAENQVRFGPSLYHEMKAPHPKKTAPQIRTILKEGKGKMPSFKDILTQEDTDNILAYLHSL